MFGGLTKTSSRIAIAAALGMTLGGFAMSAHPAKAADLGGDCCADLEERVAELEATTVRKGNKKVSVTLSGWVVKYGAFWDDGHENNFYVGDKHTTLSSHFTISGQATIAPGWTGGYNLTVEVRGGNAVGDDNQFNENSANGASLDILGNTSALLSYMWIKSDRWGTVNWGQLSQATDNVALLPDLSGTIIESNAVLFDGQAFFIRPKGAKNSNDMAMAADFTWGQVVNCLSAGGGIGADCNGYPENGVRYDSPTFSGFSVSGGVYEDKVKDIAVKYAADWNSIKFAAAFGFSNITDEGANGGGLLRAARWWWRRHSRASAAMRMCGRSAPRSCMFPPVCGLMACGSRRTTTARNGRASTLTTRSTAMACKLTNSNANQTDVWFAKAGIKRTWTPLGATVLWGEAGQYHNMYNGICGVPLLG